VGSGSLAQNSWSGVGYLLPRLLLAAMLAAVLVRPLAVLELDDASARSLGVSLKHLRLAGLGLAVFVTACVVSVVGLIGFIGLAAPAMVRCWGQKTGQRLLWAPSSAPCCWRPPICCCRPEPVLACADPDRRHDGPVGGAAALADPRLGIKQVRLRRTPLCCWPAIRRRLALLA
jgi:hypothetical protein